MAKHRLWPPLALMTPFLLLTGCASSNIPANNPDTATGGGPKVQRLVFGIAPPGIESNKAPVVATLSFWAMAPMYEFLIGVTPEGLELQPQLATEWRLEPDGRSYRFKLRRGVMFHEGNGEVTAKDVRQSWRNSVTEKEVMPPAMITFNRQVQDVEVASDDEAIIRLDKPDAGLLTLISQAENFFPITSSRDVERRQGPPTMQDAPLAGTSPYQFLERKQSEYVRYKQVPYQHWRATPVFPEFEFRFIKEDSTRLAALLAKEAHIVAAPPDLGAQAVKAGFKSIPGKARGLQAWLALSGVFINRRLQLEETLNPDPNAPFVFMNTPLLDVRVRKALNKAIDRDGLNRAFVQGRGDLVYNLFFDPSRPGWNPAWLQQFKDAYGYDPDAAKKLLAEAGYSPSNPLNLTVQVRPVAYFTAAADLDEAISNYWRAVGINATLEQADAATFASKSRALAYDRHAYVVVTSIRQLRGAGIYASALIGNRNGVQLPEMDQILQEIQTTVDSKRAEELWRQWGTFQYDRYTNVPLFWLPSDAIVDPSIVADYVFPGSISGTYTHVENIKAAK